MKTDNKTIGITIRFFTNDLPPRIGKGLKQIPCWAMGMVYIEANKTKGLEFRKGVIFHNLEEIPGAIKKVMKQAKISPVIQ